MTALRYVGRSPDSDTLLATKKFVDDQWAAVKVDNAYIDAQVAPIVAGLTTQTYVDGRDALLAQKTYVDNQDALYVPVSQRGAANGVAPLDGSVQVPSANVPPGILTDRIPGGGGSLVNNLTGTQNVSSSTNTKEFLAATRTIVDPGYPWIPFITGEVTGFATGSDPGNGLGSGIYAQAIVFDSNNTVWARAVTTSNFHPETFPLQPWAVGSALPTTLTGGMVLSLYLSLYAAPIGASTSYSFTPTGFSFEVVPMPGI